MDDATWARRANPWSVLTRATVLPMFITGLAQPPNCSGAQHHRGFPNVLNGIAFLGILFVVWEVIQLAVWPTAFGLALTYAGKFWFLDCMVWLYSEM